MYEIPDTGNLRAGELSVKYFLHLRVLDRPLQEVEIRRVNTRFGHTVAVRSSSVTHLEYRTILRPRLPVVIDARRADVRVPKPFLDLRDVSALVESVRRRRGPRRVRPKPVNADSDLLSVELKDLVHTAAVSAVSVVPLRLFRTGLNRGAEGRTPCPAAWRYSVIRSRLAGCS